MTQGRNQQFILSNLLWFGASLVMAFIVWVVATNAANPLTEQRLASPIDIQIDPPENLVITNNPPQEADVVVRAQESIFAVLDNEDIVIRADLEGLGPGTHTIELDTDVARRAVVVDTTPRQITVVLEEVQQQQVDVVAELLTEPPTGYDRTDPVFSETQALISGPTSRVQQVVAAEAEINLEDRTSTLDTNVRLIPVDADGDAVEGVTIEPQLVNVRVEVGLVEGVRAVPVTPNIDIDSRPEGYDLEGFTADPRTVLISGDLSLIPDVLRTEPISLENRIEDFEVTVPIILPSGRVFIVGDTQEVNVSVSISPIITTRAFEDIPVTTVGLGEGLESETLTNTVTLLVTGPQAEVNGLQPDDLRVVLDLTGLGPGTYDRAPIAFNGQVQIEADNISVSPNTVTVVITDPNAEATETPSGP